MPSNQWHGMVTCACAHLVFPSGYSGLLEICPQKSKPKPKLRMHACSRIPLARKFKMSFSVETRRTSPYSDDLRWRMIWQKEALGLSSSEVATRLGVDPTTVRRIIRKFKRTGNVGKEKYPVRLHPLRKLSLPIQFCIADLVLQRPGIYINELQHHILQHHGEHISSSTVCRFLHSAGFTRQRLRIAASQRDDLARANFAAEVLMYKPEMLIFLDETGSDRRNCIRREGYSIRGRPLVSRKFLSRGTRINSIAFISVCGVLDCKTYKHTVDGETQFRSIITVTSLDALRWTQSSQCGHNGQLCNPSCVRHKGNDRRGRSTATLLTSIFTRLQSH